MTDTDSLTRVVDTDAVRTGARYAYHVTRYQHCDAIRTTGIDREQRTAVGRHVDEQLHAYDDGFEDIPDNRSRCVFLYPHVDFPLSVARDAAQNVCLAVDLQRLDAEMYTADWELASQLYGGPGAEERIARKYWESCQTFTIGDDPDSELLVEGTVPPTALMQLCDPVVEKRPC